MTLKQLLIFSWFFFGVIAVIIDYNRHKIEYSKDRKYILYPFMAIFAIFGYFTFWLVINEYFEQKDREQKQPYVKKDVEFIEEICDITSIAIPEIEFIQEIKNADYLISQKDRIKLLTVLNTFLQRL